MDWGKGTLDSFRVEEVYNWRDDIMEITRRIVHETDEERLNNIAEHFEVDLSEIREFLESKQKRMGKPLTNADRIRSMSDEELLDVMLKEICALTGNEQYCGGDFCGDCKDCLWEWLKQEGGGDEDV